MNAAPNNEKRQVTSVKYSNCARTLRRRGALALAVATIVAPLARDVRAADGIWINTTSGGLWSDTTNWNGGTVASGIDATADFSTLALPADNTVHLDAPFTVGNLVFADTSATSNWFLDNNGNAANVLTLAVSTGTPTITVSNQTATISTVLGGAQGLAKAGAGTLSLTGTNTFTGSTTINAGTLRLGNSVALGTGQVSMGGGTLDVNGFSFSTPLLSGGSGTLTNSAGADATVTMNLGASVAAGYGGTITTPGTGKLNLVFNATTGGASSNFSLNAASSFSGSITVNGTGVAADVGNHGILGFGVATAPGNASNSIVLNNGGGLTNMFNPATNGGWPNHTNSMTIANPISVTGTGGVIRIGYNDTMTFSGTITGAAGAKLYRTDGGTLNLTGPSSNVAEIVLSAGTTTVGGAAPVTLTTSKITFDNTTNGVAVGTGTGSSINIGGGSIDASAVGTTNGVTKTVSAVLSGSGGLTLKGFGDTSDSGGGNGSVFSLTGTNTFTGGATIASSLVRPSADAAFGDSANTITITAGGLLANANLSLPSSRSIVLSGTGDRYFRQYGGATMTINGVISGTGNLRKTDGGTLLLAGNNTYSGTTTVGGGTLQIGNGTTDGSIASSSGITNNGALIYNLVGSQAYSNTISGGGTLTKTGAGTLTLTGANTFTGGTTIGGGTLRFGSDSSLGAIPGSFQAANITISNNAILKNNAAGTYSLNANRGITLGTGGGQVDVRGGDTVTIPGVITGTSLTVIDTGTLILTAANTYTGNTTVSGGLLQLNTGGSINNGAQMFVGTAVGAGNLTVAGGSFTTSNNNTRALDVGVGNAGTVTLSSGSISLPGSIIGDTNIGTVNQTGGTYTVGSQGFWLADGTGSTGNMNLSGGTFTSTGAATILATRGTGTITVSGTANVTLSTLQFGHTAGTNQTSTVNLNGGTLTLASMNKANATDNATFNFNGGTLKASGNSTAFMTGLNTASVKSGGAIVDDGGFAVTIAQALLDGTGGGGLTKQGAGTLTLTGANTYTGVTTIKTGTVLIGVSNVGSTSGALGTGNVTVGDSSGSASAALLTNGAFTVSNPVTAQSGSSGVLSIGGNTDSNSAFSGPITIQHAVTITQAGTTSGHALSITGGLSASSGTQTVSFAGPGATTVSGAAISNGTGTVAVNVTAGSLLLAFTNTYTGGTTLAGGILQAGVNNAIPSSGNVSFSGGTFDSNGHSDTMGPLTLTGGASTLQFGSTADSGNILTFASASMTGGTLAVTNWDGNPVSGGGADQFIFTTDPAAVLPAITFINPAGMTGTFGATEIAVTGGFEVVPIPEPASIGMVGIGVVGLLTRRRRLRAAK